jgi:hypothetical protein
MSTARSTSTLFNRRPFLLYFVARGLSEFSQQISAVAIGWQIYALTNSAFDLGLMQFIPTALLVFLAGHVADRYERKRVVQICQVAVGLAAAALAWGTFAGWLNVPEIFAAVVLFGATTAFDSPAAASMLPAVVPEGALQKGTALFTAAFQIAMIGGPALGGLAFAVTPWAPYAMMAVFSLLAAILTGAIKPDRPLIENKAPTPGSLFAGVDFVRRRDTRHDIPRLVHRDVGRRDRASADLRARHPANRTVGVRLVTLCTSDRCIVDSNDPGAPCHQSPGGNADVPGCYRLWRRCGGVRALTHDLDLGAALAMLGAADTVSMVIRISLVQLATPDEMRGRVSAVNFLFVNASYQLGEFESGLTAALFGAVPAVVLGGVGTVLVALLWMKLFPSLRNAERLE